MKVLEPGTLIDSGMKLPWEWTGSYYTSPCLIKISQGKGGDRTREKRGNTIRRRKKMGMGDNKERECEQDEASLLARRSGVRWAFKRCIYSTGNFIKFQLII